MMVVCNIFVSGEGGNFELCMQGVYVENDLFHV